MHVSFVLVARTWYFEAAVCGRVLSNRVADWPAVGNSASGAFKGETLILLLEDIQHHGPFCASVQRGDCQTWDSILLQISQVQLKAHMCQHQN